MIENHRSVWKINNREHVTKHKKFGWKVAKIYNKMSGRLTATQKSEYYYLKCVLEQEENGNIKCMILDPVKLKSFIFNALTQLHGMVGASITVDILKCEQASGEIILRVKASNMIKVWSSLTLLNNYNGIPCRFNMRQVSPYLMSLAADSREWSPVETNKNQSRYYKTS